MDSQTRLLALGFMAILVVSLALERPAQKIPPRMDLIIMTTDCHQLSYDTGAYCLRTPTASPEQIRETAIKYHVKYLVFGKSDYEGYKTITREQAMRTFKFIKTVGGFDIYET